MQAIRRARQQHHAAVRGEHQALEVHVAERVVARQPVHALLAEHQECGQAPRLHCRDRGDAPGVELVFAEMQVAVLPGHGGLLAVGRRA